MEEINVQIPTFEEVMRAKDKLQNTTDYSKMLAGYKEEDRKGYNYPRWDLDRVMNANRQPDKPANESS